MLSLQLPRCQRLGQQYIWLWQVRNFLHHAKQLTSSFHGEPFHRRRKLAVAVSCWHWSSVETGTRGWLPMGLLKWLDLSACVRCLIAEGDCIALPIHTANRQQNGNWRRCEMATTVCDMITAYRVVCGTLHRHSEIVTRNSIIRKKIDFFQNDNRFLEKNEINIPSGNSRLRIRS